MVPWRRSHYQAYDYFARRALERQALEKRSRNLVVELCLFRRAFAESRIKVFAAIVGLAQTRASAIG